MPVARGGLPGGAALPRGFGAGGPVPVQTTPLGLNQPAAPGGAPQRPKTVTEFARENQTRAGELGKSREAIEDYRFRAGAAGDKDERKALAEAGAKKAAFDRAKDALTQRRLAEVQAGQLGVDLAIEANNLRNQARLTPSAVRNVAGRNCLEIGGVWIDEGYEAKMPTVAVKAQSPAYFRILERQPRAKGVFLLGNHLLWVTPNQTALVIDTAEGREELTDGEIDRLFAAKK
jgi:Ca-activated chloride channel family protein